AAVGTEFFKHPDRNQTEKASRWHAAPNLQKCVGAPDRVILVHLRIEPPIAVALPDRTARCGTRGWRPIALWSAEAWRLFLCRCRQRCAHDEHAQQQTDSKSMQHMTFLFLRSSNVPTH